VILKDEGVSGQGSDIMGAKSGSDRLTVVQTFYHRGAAGISEFDCRWSRKLETSEQAYERHEAAGEEWQPLSAGWLKEVGLLVVRNDEGRRFDFQPSDEELARVAERVLEVGFRGPGAGPPEDFMLVHPCEALPLCPSRAGNLVIRCRCGQANYTVFAVPR